MNNQINVESETLYESSKQITDDCHNSVEKIKEFNIKWDLGIDTDKCGVLEIQSELCDLKPHITRSIKKCIVFGKVSAGKSTFINALLSQMILPTGYGPMSNFVVEVKRRMKNKNYLMVDGKEHPIKKMSNLNDQIANENLADRPHIHLFYDRRKCELLNDEVVIIDTPGVDIDGFMDIRVEDLCKESDVIILLVNAMGTLSLSDMAVISKYKTIFLKLTVLIVYTWWDDVHVKDLKGTIKQDHIRKAKTFLCNELKYPEDVAVRSIYFLSAEERLGMVSQKSRDDSFRNKKLRRERNRDFDGFFQDLKNKLSENAVKRIHSYLEPVFFKILSIESNFEHLLNEISLKREEAGAKMISDKQDKINVHINALISQKLKMTCQELIVKGDVVIFHKLGITEKADSLYSSKLTIPKLLTDIMEKHLDSLKLEIIELFSDGDWKTYSICEKTLQNLYFPKYLDLNNNIRCLDMNSIENYLFNIVSKGSNRTGWATATLNNTNEAFKEIIKVQKSSSIASTITKLIMIVSEIGNIVSSRSLLSYLGVLDLKVGLFTSNKLYSDHESDDYVNGETSRMLTEIKKILENSNLSDLVNAVSNALKAASKKILITLTSCGIPAILNALSSEKIFGIITSLERLKPYLVVFGIGAALYLLYKLYCVYKTNAYVEGEKSKVEIEIKKLENNLLDSFSNFMNDRNEEMTEFHDSIQNEFQDIKNKIRTLTTELDNFGNIQLNP